MAGAEPVGAVEDALILPQAKAKDANQVLAVEVLLRNRLGKLCNCPRLWGTKAEQQASTIFLGSNPIGFPSLSTNQWNTLLILLNTQPSNTDKMFGKVDFNLNWILDFDCSHHMIGKSSYLTNLQSTLPYVIGLSNGSEAFSKQ